MKPIRIKEAKRPPIFLKPYMWKNLFNKNSVAITFVQMHILSLTSFLSKELNLSFVEVDEVKFTKGWFDQKGVQWAP